MATEPTVDVPSAVNALLHLAERTPSTPHGMVMVHRDELMDIVTRFLTAPTVIGCGCLGVADGRGTIHRITNICPVHRVERPVDFYGDGFWAGYHGGDGIDPDQLDADDRAEWDNGYAAGLSGASSGVVDVRPL